jgi:Holliday junction resolvasome RuvABC endonuclease subunit
MIITGVDPGTRDAGIVTVRLDGDNVKILFRQHQQRIKREDEAGFLCRLGISVRYQAMDASPDIIACEAAHFRVNHKTHAALAKSIGVVEQTAASVNIPHREIQPSSWKKAITGDGEAGYPTIRLFMCSILGSQLPMRLTEHEIAAIGIAIATGRSEQTDRQIEAAGKREGRDK